MRFLLVLLLVTQVLFWTCYSYWLEQYIDGAIRWKGQYVNDSVLYDTNRLGVCDCKILSRNNSNLLNPQYPAKGFELYPPSFPYSRLYPLHLLQSPISIKGLFWAPIDILGA